MWVEKKKICTHHDPHSTNCNSHFHKSKQRHTGEGSGGAGGEKPNQNATHTNWGQYNTEQMPTDELRGGDMETKSYSIKCVE